jgi:hypothetical protein
LASQRAINCNSVKQVLLASHNYADVNRSLWPNVDGNRNTTAVPGSVVRALCPYLEADMDHPPKLIRFNTDPSLQFAPTEPSSPLPGTTEPDIQLSVTSLAFNPLVYTGKRFSESISDGMSATIAITEHYGLCENAQFDWRHVTTTCLDFPAMTVVPCSSSSQRRATFADGRMYQDVVPVTTEGNSGPISAGSLSLTFQVLPLPNQCDPRIPQSSLPGGLLCGFADGSVRFVGRNVSEATFWGSVTPDRGEIVFLE